LNRLSLRARLTLAFLALAGLMAVLGGTTALIHSRIRRQITTLQPDGGVDLKRVDLQRSGLEIKGFWDPKGVFVATDLELLPATSNPKLRGPLEAVDAARGTFTLYGREIQVDGDTELLDGGAGTELDLWKLAPGQRVEVSCDVDDGVWKAEELSLEGLKGNDKIKATVTSAELDGRAPETLEIHGLIVSVNSASEVTPEGGLNHVRTATSLLLAVLDLRNAAGDLSVVPVDAPRIAERLRGAAQNISADLEASMRTEDGAAVPGAWLGPLMKVRPDLLRHVEELVRLSEESPQRAEEYRITTFLPFLEQELEPRIYVYLSQSEDDLGDQLESMAARTSATWRIALAISVGAMLLALVLGLLVWRSIHRPIAALHAAAQRLGEGHLDTRVEISGKDELAELGASFNRMAADLAATTVSIANLENVFDSMSGALFLLDNERRISGVNRAALELLGYARNELQGRSIEVVCPWTVDSKSPVAESSRASAPSERTLRRRDGTSVPASFSAARLGSNGSARGYVCIAQDLTERKRIEERVRTSLAEKELLLREVHHRVKNNLQVISSLLAIQSLQSGDPRLIAGFEESQARIRSMALIHEQLYHSDGIGEIDERIYLNVLLEHLERSYGRGDAIRLELEAEDVALGLDESLACGLIVSELVSNAFKHAFPGSRKGTIRVALATHGADEVSLSVSDDGCGLAAQTDPGQTLGMSLVATLAEQLGGSYSVESEHGVSIRVVFPYRRQGAEVPR
jgi:PAS domain S-box-containing protein